MIPSPGQSRLSKEAIENHGVLVTLVWSVSGKCTQIDAGLKELERKAGLLLHLGAYG
jgi:hypothetical protein